MGFFLALAMTFFRILHPRAGSAGFNLSHLSSPNGKGCSGEAERTMSGVKLRANRMRFPRLTRGSNPIRELFERRESRTLLANGTAKVFAQLERSFAAIATNQQIHLKATDLNLTGKTTVHGLLVTEDSSFNPAAVQIKDAADAVV